MENGNYSDASNDRDTMFMFGGAALMLLGAGMILSNPAIKKYLGQMNPSGLLTAALPDLDKYLKLRAM